MALAAALPAFRGRDEELEDAARWKEVLDGLRKVVLEFTSEPDHGPDNERGKGALASSRCRLLASALRIAEGALLNSVASAHVETQNNIEVVLIMKGRAEKDVWVKT